MVFLALWSPIQWMIGEEHLFPLRPLAGAETSPEHPPKVTWPSMAISKLTSQMTWRLSGKRRGIVMDCLAGRVCPAPWQLVPVENPWIEFPYDWYWMHGDTLPMFSCLKVLKAYLRTAWVKGWEHVRSCITYIILHILRSELGCNGSSTFGMSQNQGCIALLQFEPPMKWSTDRGVLLIFLEGLSGLPSKILRLRQQFVGHFQAETGGLMEGDCCL